MKKVLLSLGVSLIASLTLNAQCIPDPQFTSSGVYPDSTTGIADGCAGQFYEQLITVVVPSDTTLLVGPFPITLTYDSVVITNITGLPAGLTYSCYDAQNVTSPFDQCAFEGATTGCLLVSGTLSTSAAGSYNISVALDAYLGGGTSPALSTVIDYYTLEVLPSTLSTITETACLSYTSPSGKIWTTSNTYLDTIPSSSVCDSIITINLTITSINSQIVLSGNSLTTSESGASYQWLECPAMTEINGETNQTFTPTNIGSYAVEVTKNGCIDTSSCFTVTNLGIIENSFEKGLLVYPNPTDGNLTIDLGNNYSIIEVTITDLNGKVIHTKQYKEKQLLNLTIDEPAGIYLLTIVSQDKKAVIELVKE